MERCCGLQRTSCVRQRRLLSCCGVSLRRLLAFCVLCCCMTAALSSSSHYILEDFTDFLNTGSFHNLVVHRSSGKIFVGAENKLYLLSETLGLEKTESTGPRFDVVNCLPPFGPGCDNRKLTNCVNKALVIDYENTQLITCSNLFQGHCEHRSLIDLSVKDPQRWVPIVPNDAESPVVILIAPAPSEDPSLIGGSNRIRPQALYIAATRSVEESIYKDMVPTISSRNISTFEFVYDDTFTSTKIEVEPRQSDTFRINYIKGFSSGGFTYFLTVQTKSLTETEQYVSRIVRVCQNDTRYYSYAEVPLSCTHNNTEYKVVQTAYLGVAGKELAISLNLPDLESLRTNEDVLYAIFSNQSPGEATPGMFASSSAQSTAGTGSVMCVYTMRDVRRVFTTNVQECFKGMGNTGPPHLSRADPCRSWDDVEKVLNDDYCGRYEFNHPIAGTEPVAGTAVIHFPNSTVTAVAVTETYDYTVAFLGTENGHLKKVAVETRDSAVEYESIVIQEGSKVNPDMAFDRSRKHLYVMTEKKVTRVKVQHCHQHTNCSLCLGAKDPFCGWCSLDNRCTPRKECTNAEDPMRWLPYSGSQCTKIVKVIPDKVQIQARNSTTLTVTVQNLPTLTNGQYECAYRMGNGTPRFTRATLLGDPMQESTNRTLQCDTPMPIRLPPIPTGKDHIVMTLSVRMDNRDFVDTDITFFNCDVHTSCSSCTDSEFPCSWCVRSHQCTYNRENCMSDTIITGKNLPGQTDHPGPEFCPRITNHITEILVSSGTSSNVHVEARNLQMFQGDFFCEFSLNGPRTVGARRQNQDNLDIIQCDTIQFRYAGNSHSRAVPFKILWGPDQQPLDNPDKIQVMMYKCSAMASNCGECLTTHTKYLCGWCPARGECMTPGNCEETWLDHNSDCPNPTITKFEPTQGPTKGGTLVTIKGENLGKQFSDVEYGVTIAGIGCKAVAKEYRPASVIVCRTGKTHSDRSGPIEIEIRSFTAQSAGLFSYVEPYIMGVTPDKGPRSGGTSITVTGEYMDAGTNIIVTVGEHRCRDQDIYPAMIVCTVPAMSQHGDIESRVRVSFDRAEMVAETFLYMDDPDITDIKPEKGIYSGGTMLHVTGSRLHIIQSPRVAVYYQGRRYTGRCQNVTKTSMRCISPSFLASGMLTSDLQGQDHVTLTYGFLMDGVVTLSNMTERSQGARVFEVYRDPKILPFDEGIRSVFQLKKHDDLLTINGENLDVALSEHDVHVMVGSQECVVTSLSTTVLTCAPPNLAQHSLGHKPDVFVYVGGNNLTFYVGQLQIESPDPTFTLPIIILIAAASGLFILVTLVVVVIYKRRSRESDRAIKRMQNQMDKLEAMVAKECKEAFAELQTDMTEITGDICGPTGIPFRDYRNFCMRVLFPNSPEDDHPVTRKRQEYLNLSNPNIDRGLQQFNMLIQHKLFLLIFIRTLEQDSSFTAKEKVNVASLISCALQNRMEYHTEILKTLLAELIEKSMDSREHPKLLLRRTNSVAEKMLTNWFTFLLHKFLKECVGEPLYMLFRAMKQQVDKGPVDALSSEARYSLSEDKLIRDRIEYKQLTIYIVDTSYPSHEHPVRVLDCDTVTQVKEKALDAIYKNRPFSTRPDKDDLDLEWRTGETGRLTLHDEDTTTKMEGEYRRLNTLGHYHVHDNARMALVRKQTSMYNISVGSEKSHLSHVNNFNVTYSGSPSLSRSISPHNMIQDMENGAAKYCHLVKHDLDLHKEGERGNKMVSEIYLTRLLATKGTLQQFVDDLLETIFSTATRRCALPLAIKYMFDFLDDQALHHCITDPEVVHTWKSNSLPLRFWINVVKNPDFVFDIHKSNIVDACLSVVAQTFMDSCSMSEHRLGKDSPSSKLLYAKDIPKYKKWVERYYQDIKQMPAISDQDMNAMLAEESRIHQDEFHLNAALYELYHYVAKYKDSLIENLQEDEFARNYHLVDRLIRVTEMIETEA